MFMSFCCIDSIQIFWDLNQSSTFFWSYFVISKKNWKIDDLNFVSFWKCWNFRISSISKLSFLRSIFSRSWTKCFFKSCFWYLVSKLLWYLVTRLCSLGPKSKEKPEILKWFPVLLKVWKYLHLLVNKRAKRLKDTAARKQLKISFRSFFVQIQNWS